MHLSIVQPLSPTKFSPVTAYDASYQASVRALDKSLTKNGLVANSFPEPAKPEGAAIPQIPKGSDRRVDDELQRGVIIGLKTSIFQFEPALLGMDQGFSSCRHAADVVGLPPARKFGTAFAEPRQQVAEGGIAGPQVMCRAELGDDAPGLIRP